MHTRRNATQIYEFDRDVVRPRSEIIIDHTLIRTSQDIT